MTTQADSRPTVRYTLTCPVWCTADHSLPSDSGLHGRGFPVPGLDDGEPTVQLAQLDPVSRRVEAASISVYPPRDRMTGREALDLAEALAYAAEALLPQGAEPRQVEVVQVLPDLVALGDAQGGLRVSLDADAPGMAAQGRRGPS